MDSTATKVEKKADELKDATKDAVKDAAGAVKEGAAKVEAAAKK
jgi:hypothetical protein